MSLQASALVQRTLLKLSPLLGGVTADGKDLLTLLGRSYNDLASKSNSAGAAANAGGKGLKK